MLLLTFSNAVTCGQAQIEHPARALQMPHYHAHEPCQGRTSSSVSLQPRAPAASRACFAFLAPGMGMAPLHSVQLMATCHASTCS